MTTAPHTLRNGLLLLAPAAFLGGTAVPAACQTTNDPFPQPIEASAGVIEVGFTDFATLPDIDGAPARMMTWVDERGTDRFFVSDMRGPIYRIARDGGEVGLYVDVNEGRWGSGVEAGGRERGVQRVAFHPDIARAGAPGYGRFYTWADTNRTAPADFTAPGDGHTHDTVLHEWVALDPFAPVYDGGPPRELARFAQPFANHNGGHLAFHPTAAPGSPEYGLLYVGVADGGSGGDPLNLSLDLTNGFGKLFRIDPLGSNSANGAYGIPADNPFVGRADVLPEIYAYGLRNPQRFGWDPVTGNLFLADIGQNIIEKLTLVPAGANLGWNAWEGSFRYVSRTEVDVSDPRGDPGVTFPVAEYDQIDPILQPSSAVTGVVVYRSDRIPHLRNRVLFGDFPTGEIFHIDADDLPAGGQDAIRRVLLVQGGERRTFLQVIRETNEAQGRAPATRTDLRFGEGPDGRVFLLNKQDGVIRELSGGS